MAYKDSPFLSECLDSLKNQTLESKIYICTSTPSAFINEIAKKYSVEVFVTESGKGISNDWNFGLQMAKTKYVTLAHQDDLYMPEYTERCINIIEKFDDALICFTGYSEIVDKKDRSGTLLLRVKSFMLWFFMPAKKNIRSKFWKKKLLSLGSPIATPSVLYNRDNLSSFQFSSEFSISVDWDAWYRMATMDGRFVYVNKTLLKHKIHTDSATTAGLVANLRQSEDLRMFKRYWPGFLAKVLAKFYARSYKSNNDITT